MKESLRIGGRERIDITNKSFNSIDLDFQVQHTTVNTAFTPASIVDTNKLDVTITLEQAGNKLTVYQGSLKPLLMLLHYGTRFYDSYCGNTGLNHIVVDKDTTVKEVQNIRYRIPLGMFNLKDGEKLSVEFNLLGSIFSSAVDTSASSVIVSVQDAIGLQTSIPIIARQTIASGRSVISNDLKNNVTQVFIFSKTSGVKGNENMLLKDVSLKSDKANFHYTINELIHEMEADFVNITDVSKTYPNVMIYDGFPLNDAHIDIQLNSDAVVQNNQELLVKMDIATLEIAKRYQNLKIKHDKKNLKYMPK